MCMHNMYVLRLVWIYTVCVLEYELVVCMLWILSILLCILLVRLVVDQS